MFFASLLSCSTEAEVCSVFFRLSSVAAIFFATSLVTHATVTLVTASNPIFNSRRAEAYLRAVDLEVFSALLLAVGGAAFAAAARSSLLRKTAPCCNRGANYNEVCAKCKAG